MLKFTAESANEGGPHLQRRIMLIAHAPEITNGNPQLVKTWVGIEVGVNRESQCGTTTGRVDLKCLGSGASQGVHLSLSKWAD